MKLLTATSLALVAWGSGIVSAQAQSAQDQSVSLSIEAQSVQAQSTQAQSTQTRQAQAPSAQTRQTQAQSAIDQLQGSRACKGCDLINANLAGLDLSNTDLTGANLSNANLSGANLSGANLSGTNLFLANFTGANLQGADLSQANLKSAVFQSADLTGSTLSQADLSYAKLPSANLTQANLTEAKLDSADLTEANLTEAKLPNANLGFANLTQANADRADFSNAKLSGSNLSNVTNLETANLAGTDLTGANLIGTTLPDAAIAQTPSTPPRSGVTKATPAGTTPTRFTAADSPLKFAQFLTAETLSAGDVVLNFRQRFYTNTTSVVAGSGTPFFAGPGVRVGITNNLEVAAAFQVFDSSFLDSLGGRIDNPNYDLAVQAKYKIWQNEAKTQTLSGVVAVSGGISRGATFNRNGVISQVNGSGLVPSFQLPFTFLVGDRASFTVAPTLALFQKDSALLVPRVPDLGGTFGTTFGLAGAASYQLSSRLIAWGDIFVPFTGNNSLNFKTGQPAKTVVVNAGLRYLVNPRLGLDVFATNSLGDLGPISLTADRTNFAIGAGITVMPDLLFGNRRYPNNFEGQYNQKDSPLTTDGLSFFDGGTVPAGKVLVQFQGGSAGIMTAVRYGVVKDLEFGAYLDYVFGKVDESEQGVSAKVRLLNQAEGAPFTLSAAATIGRGNNLLENFRTNNGAAFTSSGFDKSFPFIFSGDNAANLFTLFIGTVSLPIQYQFKEGTAIWVTPSASFIQRGGLSLAGVNVGGSYQIVKDVSLLGEVGVNLAGDGNAFVNNRLVDRIPWNFAVRWQPSKLLGIDFSDALARPSFELFVTNRVGASTFHELRVREGNNPAVGVGVSIPF